MPRVGLEPTRIAPADFKSAASANSATPAKNKAILLLLTKGFKQIWKVVLLRDKGGKVDK